MRPYVRTGRRFHKLSELAYRKRHHAHFNDETSAQTIATLRQSLAELDDRPSSSDCLGDVRNEDGSGNRESNAVCFQ